MSNNSKLLNQIKKKNIYFPLKWRIFLGIFLGYAGYYLVRKNFVLAMPYLIENGFNKGELGFALSGISIAYGISKFIMGIISDRSNPKIFLSLGLILSASVMLILGFIPWTTSNIFLIFIFLFILGWFQGMGWPPCGKTIVHWWSKEERGTIISIWNCSHNIGGGIPPILFIYGMLWFNNWKSAFYMPAFLAIFISFIVFWLMLDIPKSHTLPEMKKKYFNYKNHINKSKNPTNKKKIFIKYILYNKKLWMIAIANIFIYLIRYGILDWSPTYLYEIKSFNLDQSSWTYFLYEYAGIPGTLLCGWLSDHMFKGNRGATGLCFMLLVTIIILIFWINPPGNIYIDIICMISIGFLIYGPVMLIGLYAIELVPKHAAGTAAGFTGLFGYLGGSVAASAIVGYTVQYFNWNGGFILMIAGGIVSIILLFLVMKQEKNI
ncbi:MAG: glycerol-3-phosphate transporter [Arsenophonus sp.]|nr:MAG: glycerol-3-phosphate transporter [Arsenophonus sp.]